MAAQPMPDDEPPGKKKGKRTQTKRWYDREHKNQPVGHLVDEWRTLTSQLGSNYRHIGSGSFRFLRRILARHDAARSRHSKSHPAYARTAIDLFMYLLPTASMVITHWFATRGTGDS